MSNVISEIFLWLLCCRSNYLCTLKNPHPGSFYHSIIHQPFFKYPKHPQAKTSQYGNGKSYVWTPHPKGAKPKDVFEIPTLTNNSWEREKHPTQKPIELVRKCILASSNHDSLIVDPFGGSGTTYAVAEAFKRRWLGTETNLEYCKIIKRRLQDKEHIRRIFKNGEESEIAKRRHKLRGQ